MVGSYQKISDTDGNFSGTLVDSDEFGSEVSAIGDVDGDGITDLAVGAPHDDDGGSNRGAVWILFLDTNGTVKSEQKISDTQGGFSASMNNGDDFGMGVTAIGDFDGDGVPDIAVGAQGDNDGGNSRGCVYLLFLNSNGTVKSYQKISDTQGSFGGSLDDYDHFGCDLASLGDLDGDGVTDIVVGAWGDDDGVTGEGAVYLILLNSSGTVKSEHKISKTQGNFGGTLDMMDQMGSSVTCIGDLDGNGVVDIVAGAPGDDDGGTSRGALWVLFLKKQGPTYKVDSYQKISSTQGGFTGVIDNSDLFGISVASLGDLNGDSIPDIVVGAYTDDDGGSGRGAVWNLFLNSNGTVDSYQKVSDIEGGFTGTLDNGDLFGISVDSIGDLDNDGINDIAVGAYRDDDGGTNKGAVWILFSGGPVLPLQLVSFEAYPVYPGDVRIDWETASEINNKAFILEKRENGDLYQEVAVIEGHGYSQESHQYSVTDRSPFNGLSYYRLKQMDYDGKTTYSNIVTVFMAVTQPVISINPNPSAGQRITLYYELLEPEKINVKLYNSLGAVIIERSFDSKSYGHAQLDFQRGLDPGFYFLEIVSQRTKLTRKLVVY